MNTEELRRIIENWGRHFEPTTSSRGQGGLPVTGIVIDWEMNLTKYGWNIYKEKLIDEISQNFIPKSEVEKWADSKCTQNNQHGMVSAEEIKQQLLR